MHFLADFKKFALRRGNIVDMSVGIIIGAAFGNIVTSAVSDIIMPPIGLLLGGVDFSDLAIVLKASTIDSPAVVIGYGKFIQTVIDFTIIGFAIFLLIRMMNRVDVLREPRSAADLTRSEELLTEIRDHLTQRDNV